MSTAPDRPSRGCVTYQLIISIARRTRIAVGRLGVVELPAGRYVYTGSAKRGLAARVARHLSRNKRLRWHIDYLLAARGVRVEAVRYSRRAECDANRLAGGVDLVAGFGSSDCHAGCGSHLKHLGRAADARRSMRKRRVPESSNLRPKE